MSGDFLLAAIAALAMRSALASVVQSPAELTSEEVEAKCAKAEGPCVIEHVSIAGKERCALLAGEVRLSDVRCVSQGVGFVVQPNSRVTLDGVQVQSVGPGLVVQEGSNVIGKSFVGRSASRRWLVDVRGGTLSMGSVELDGGGVRMMRGRLAIESLAVKNSEYGLLHASGTASLKQFQVTASVSGVFVRGGQLNIASLTASTIESAGVALLGGQFLAERVEINGAADGIQLLGGIANIQTLKLKKMQGVGLLVRTAEAVIGDMSVTEPVKPPQSTPRGPIAEAVVPPSDGTTAGETNSATRGAGADWIGDSIHVRDATLELGRLVVRGGVGACIWLSNYGQVKAKEVDCDLSEMGVVAERFSIADIGKMQSARLKGPALGATESASVAVGELRVDTPHSPWWRLACTEATSMRVSKLDGAGPPDAALFPCYNAAKKGDNVAVKRSGPNVGALKAAPFK